MLHTMFLGNWSSRSGEEDFLPGLGLPSRRPILSYGKLNPCQNFYGKKRFKVRSTACHTLKYPEMRKFDKTETLVAIGDIT